MAGLSYEDVELRKLPPRFRFQLSQILDIDDAWKKLMGSIPSSDRPHLLKYRAEHISLVERHSLSTKKLPAEILLDEWSTSGRVRPTGETLYELLQECQLFRAADYVATEILCISPPVRPPDGPAKTVPPPLPSNLNESKENNDTAATVLVQELKLNSLLEKLNNYNYSKGTPIEFDLDIIERGTNNFKNPIGSGAFGTVYKMELGPIQAKLAVKVLHQNTTLMEDQFITEIRVLSEFRHENIVPLVGFCTNGPEYCLVYEFMSGGTLLAGIASNDSCLAWSDRKEVLLGTIRGINYLHTAKEKPLIHRDIKSANVLLERQSGMVKSKLGDFGLAKSFSPGNQTSSLTSTIFGTGPYMAPEAFRGDISPKMDVFSYGVIILEILTGLPPFDEDREEGRDIVTFLEEKVDNDDIVPWLDERMSADVSETGHVYEIALQCLAEKRRRPMSDQILQLLLSRIPSKTFQAQNTF